VAVGRQAFLPSSMARVKCKAYICDHAAYMHPQQAAAAETERCPRCIRCINCYKQAAPIPIYYESANRRGMFRSPRDVKVFRRGIRAGDVPYVVPSAISPCRSTATAERIPCLADQARGRQAVGTHL